MKANLPSIYKPQNEKTLNKLEFIKYTVTSFHYVWWFAHLQAFEKIFNKQYLII